MKNLFRPNASLPAAMLLAWLPLLGSATAAVSQKDTVRPIHYEIVKRGDAWQLLADGQPLYLNGAVGWSHFDVLRQCGGNAVRARASRASLDRAHAHGLRVMAGLPVRGERSRMDWSDPQQVAQQMQTVLAVVEELKDHPALMLWVVGNELDWIPPGIPHDPSLWERLNDLAVAIGRLDPHHPVLTVIGTGRYQQKIRQIAQSCPDMDLLGINAYGDIEQVTELTRKHWPKSYLVAEWGPTGHWQVPKTKWRVPLEQASSEKAQAVQQRYTKIIQADEKHCLGSFVFLWGQKQETTHTWYGMFRDGKRTESVDVMQYLWSGDWPANRAPAVQRITISGFPDQRSVYLSQKGPYRATVDCSDPDGDRLTFHWDIRPEVEIPKNSYAGGLEKRARPIPGLIGDPTTQTVRFSAPANSGPYRLFVEVTDPGGSIGYANLPFYVEDRVTVVPPVEFEPLEVY